jgi:hypothetical protein
VRKEEVETLFGGYTYYCREQQDKKATIKYSNTTANTHGSYMEEKDPGRPQKPPTKNNNFFKV